MRVCYVTDWSATIAGAQQSLLNLFIGLKEKGVTPYLVSHINWEILTLAEKEGIEVKCVKGKLSIIGKEDKTLFTYMKYPLKRIYNYMHLKEAIFFLKINKIELVHLNSLLASEIWARAALKCGIPYIWHIREFVEKDHNRVIINKKYIYGLVRKAKQVITISKDVNDYWEEELKRKCVCIYNGIPLEENYDTVEGKFRSKQLRCMIVGRVVENKGQMEAVKAVERMLEQGYTNIHLSIVGYRARGEYEKQMVEYIKSNDLADYIEVIDYTHDLKNIRNSHDVGLVCSKAEAFGRVTIEYKFAGMLAIGTNTGGTPELINDGETGFLYEQGNYKALAEVLKKIINEPGRARSIALYGQKMAIEKFEIGRTTEKIYNLYEQILG
jgi:Glycosyltransferase